MAGRRGRGRGPHQPSKANAIPPGNQRSTRSQAQPTTMLSGSQHDDEIVADVSINARHAGTAPPLLSVQRPHPRNDAADHAYPSGHNPAFSTPTPEGQPGSMADDANASAPEVNDATDKPKGRKRKEDSSDTDALPTKRAKTDGAPGNSDDQHRSANKNGVLLDSPIQHGNQIPVPTSGHAESTFNLDTDHASKKINKPVEPPQRDLVQEILNGILPEEAEAALRAWQQQNNTVHNSLGAWQEAEAETDSQCLEPSVSVNEQPEGSHVRRGTVSSPPHEARDSPSIRNNDDQALQALKYLEDPKVQEVLARNHGKRALQVGRGLTEKRFAQTAVNKYDPRDGWIHDEHASRAAGASESGLVIEFDMPVTRGDPSPPNPDSTRWVPALDGITVMIKKTLGIVTTNDEEFKNVKVFTTKSNTSLKSLRKDGKLGHYAQIIRSPQEDKVEREEGVFCHLEIVCDDIDDINMNIAGPRFMATMPSYQLSHTARYRRVGYLKDPADVELFGTLQKKAAAVAVEQSLESLGQRREGWFQNYRDTNSTAGDNSTVAPQVSSFLLHCSMIDRLTCSRPAYSPPRTPISHRCCLLVEVPVKPPSPTTNWRATELRARSKKLRCWRPHSSRVSLGYLMMRKNWSRVIKSDGMIGQCSFLLVCGFSRFSS